MESGVKLDPAAATLPEDAGTPGRGLVALLEDVAEMMLSARSAAMLAVIAGVVAMLRRKWSARRRRRRPDVQEARCARRCHVSRSRPKLSKGLADASCAHPAPRLCRRAEGKPN